MIFGPEHDRECADKIREAFNNFRRLLAEAKERNISVTINVRPNVWIDESTQLTALTITKTTKETL